MTESIQKNKVPETPKNSPKYQLPIWKQMPQRLTRYRSMKFNTPTTLLSIIRCVLTEAF